MTQHDLSSLLGDQADPVAAGYHLKQLAQGGVEHGLALLMQLSEQRETIAHSDPAIVGGLLHVLHTLLLRPPESESQSGAGVSLAQAPPQMIGQLALALPDETPNQHLLLHLLAMIRSGESLGLLSEILVNHPPKQWMHGALVISPLMQRNDWPCLLYTSPSPRD